MITDTSFIVLIEPRGLKRPLVAVLASFALVTGVNWVKTAHAAPPPFEPKTKIARDLDDELAPARQPRARWARDINGVRHVQIVVVSNASDPDMTDLSAYVRGIGGAIHAAHPSIRALSIQIKASQVAALSSRSDVVSVSPNRATQSTAANTLENVTGALGANVRSRANRTAYSGIDGTGIGIAVLDSGVMKAHDSFGDASGARRVKRSVSMLNASTAKWTTAGTSATSLMPGSLSLMAYENAIDADGALRQDPYGHGTHVASVAAGRGYTAGDAAEQDINGIAPNASIYDVRILGDQGTGTLSDALEGIQWVIYHAKEYNIRVLNLSIAASSTESWQTDPLCVAVRSATAAGLTVVVAAGNYGLTSGGVETYGRISSPGNDPSVITVGAVNLKGTAGRADDSVNFFSSRGPTRSAYVDSSGVRRVDNLLKPDLVAPGNKIVGASATTSYSLSLNYLASTYGSNLVAPLGIRPILSETQMMLSGTSIAAPVVAGTVALMLQANPGLTPPLVKAILQYSAQPLPNANLLQQGAGLLNVDGAIQLSRVLRTDLNTAIGAGTIATGATMLAPGKALPTPSSTINGTSFNWSRIVFAGGNHVVSGDVLKPSSRSTTRASPGPATSCASARPSTGRVTASRTTPSRSRSRTARCRTRSS